MLSLDIPACTRSTGGESLYLGPKWFLSLGVSYDNTHAVLWRPGITFRSR